MIHVEKFEAKERCNLSPWEVERLKKEFNDRVDFINKKYEQLNELDRFSMEMDWDIKHRTIQDDKAELHGFAIACIMMALIVEYEDIRYKNIEVKSNVVTD